MAEGGEADGAAGVSADATDEPRLEAEDGHKKPEDDLEALKAVLESCFQAVKGESDELRQIISIHEARMQQREGDLAEILAHKQKTLRRKADLHNQYVTLANQLKLLYPEGDGMEAIAPPKLLSHEERQEIMQKPAWATPRVDAWQLAAATGDAAWQDGWSQQAWLQDPASQGAWPQEETPPEPRAPPGLEAASGGGAPADAEAPDDGCLDSSSRGLARQESVEALDRAAGELEDQRKRNVIEGEAHGEACDPELRAKLELRRRVSESGADEHATAAEREAAGEEAEGKEKEAEVAGESGESCSGIPLAPALLPPQVPTAVSAVDVAAAQVAGEDDNEEEC